MRRVACFALLAAVGASSCSADVPASLDRAATSTTEAERATSATAEAAEPGTELLGHRWVTVSAEGFGADRDPAAYPATLTFERDGETTTLTTDGCDSAAYPVTFEPNHRLAVGAALSHSMCANPFDFGQAIPNLLALPLQWSVAGDRLTLTYEGSSLTLTDHP